MIIVLFFGLANCYNPQKPNQKSALKYVLKHENILETLIIDQQFNFKIHNNKDTIRGTYKRKEDTLIFSPGSKQIIKFNHKNSHSKRPETRIYINDIDDKELIRVTLNKYDSVPRNRFRYSPHLKNPLADTFAVIVHDWHLCFPFNLSISRKLLNGKHWVHPHQTGYQNLKIPLNSYEDIGNQLVLKLTDYKRPFEYETKLLINGECFPWSLDFFTRSFRTS